MTIYWTGEPVKHYHIDVIVNEEQVQVIKEQFNSFLEDAEGFTIRVIPDNDEAEVSPELDEAIRRMFINLLVAVKFGKFKGVN